MAESIGDRLKKLETRYGVDEALVFGLDVGIASVGSAVVRHDDREASIAFAGSRCFEASEDPKTKTLKNKTRRDKRLLRRVIRRRALRMTNLRALLVDHTLLKTADPDAFHHRAGAPDPWKARAEGLDRALSDEELAAALVHIAKHRGFKSNKKSDIGQNASDDNKQMLGAISVNRELLARYGTIGRMVVSDPKFAVHKRNKGGEYTHTFARDDLHAEIINIFNAQRRLGNAKATPELESKYLGMAFHQRSLQDSEGLVGTCPFEPDEKRCPRHAPSFEKFRFLAKLNTVKVREANGSLRRLTREELHRAVADFGISSKSITWKALGKKLGLSTDTVIDGLDEKRASADMAASGGCAFGTKTLYDAIGPTGWNAISGNPAILDAVVSVIAFRDDLGRIEEGLRSVHGLEPPILEALINAVGDGDFAAFKGTGHISAKAARNILPYLLDGLVYSDACAAAGYDHSLTRRIDLDDIKNPVVQRSLREALKQVETLIHQFGARPGRIVVELARDVGKSVEERDQMTRGIERRTAEKMRRRAELKHLLNLSVEPTDEDLRRFELWKEQNYRCIYTDREIVPGDVLASRNTVQVDHILPRSRSQDNSYQNQVLCFAKANQDKRQRTPWEWKVRDEKDELWWNEFEVRVRALHIKGIKKRNLLMPNFDERKQGFAARNLNDTRYATRALLAALRDLYAAEDEPDPVDEGYFRARRRLFARPGAVTAILRSAWGFAGVKDRADDRHHALDAIICAAAGNEWLLNRLTLQYQKIEAENRAKWIPNVPEPWPDFRDDAMTAYGRVFVSRSEKRRGRGQGHKDTIYGLGIEEGRKVTYERKALAALTISDLDRLKDADGGNRPLARTLAVWFDRGKPADDPPMSPKGDPIRKVVLKRKGVSGFELNGGHVDNADMVRVDIFSKPNRRGNEEFYLVPVYRHQVMNRTQWPQPPNLSIVAYKPETEWTVIDSSFTFRFSLYPDAYIEVTKRDGEVVEGYYRSADRSTGALSLSAHNFREPLIRGIGAKTLRAFRKFHVDRLGRKHEIKRETRTWHGAVCT